MLDPKTLPVTPAGFVACVTLIDEAGSGLRTGEVRGFTPETAARMIDKGTAALYTPERDVTKSPRAPKSAQSTGATE